MSDSVDMLAALGHEAELVTYTPSGGVAKTFRALIDRQPSQMALVSSVAYPESALSVTFPKDATDGVLTVSKGHDRIKFKRHRGDSDETEFTVVMIQSEDAGLVSHDGGMFTVLVK